MAGGLEHADSSVAAEPEAPESTRAVEAEAIPAALTGASDGSGYVRDGAGAPHAARFRTATALLAGMGLAAIAVAVVLLIGGRGTTAGTGGPWSSWAPTASGTDGANQIAQHVAPLYRLSGTAQLAVVTVVKVAAANAVAAAAQTGQSSAGSGLGVAVQTSASSAQISLLGGTTIAYNLCGLGSSDCSIGIGTPSSNRLLLLRREALELALYTFKYLATVDNVVVILPPGHTQRASSLTPNPPSVSTKASAAKPVDIAVLFLRDEVKFLLNQPLSVAFPEPYPPTVDQIANSQSGVLAQQITSRGLFSEKIEQEQDGTSLLALTPIAAQ